MKRIVVIGENSYIGTSFGAYMQQKEPTIQVEFVEARNGEWKQFLFSSEDMVLHVAAIVHKKEKEDMAQLYQDVNTTLPVEVAKKCKEQGVHKFVFMSTMAVYGNQESPIGKEAKEAPDTMYGKSKLAAEKELAELASKEFQVIVVRPPMVYGPKCPGNYERLAKLAYKIPIFPKVNNQRSMIYIETLCECIRKQIMEEGTAIQVICPQNMEYVNTTELVKQIRKAHKKRTFILPFPQKMIEFMTRKSGTVEKVFGNCYYQRQKDDIKYQVCDFAESICRTEESW